MTDTAHSVAQQLFEFIQQSRDGYAIYDVDDRLCYCNGVFKEMFCIEGAYQHLNFADLIRHTYAIGRGIRLDTDNIEVWLTQANAKRRSRPFRLFEVDMMDGRWFLLSEQIRQDGALLVQAKDITKQKVMESELIRSVDTLHQMALTDALTGIANRRSFVESVESELSRCRRDTSLVSQLLLDLDHFKNINDTYGHQGGDAVLKQVANTIKKTLRQYDIFGRIGGEEFAVFLGSTDAQTAMEIAQRLCQAVAASTIHHGQAQIRVTTSIGVTTRECDTSFEQLYLEADDALYQAKQAGRNRVISYQQGPDSGQIGPD
ncbi:sensor domain-containing diguanylate cyclase [Bowmanella denitrificans]|uniref:diguanylate cyclase n=1 Tax=Bowmanella denitrificans TaxID=366582 RepID=A0ABP3H0R5_9ALTE